MKSLFSKNQSKKQAKESLYSNCSELMIDVFFEITKTKNLHLLIKKDNEAAISDSRLIEVWESIQLEFEKLTGSNDYRMLLRKKSNDIQKLNRLNGLISLFYIASYTDDDISEDIKFWNVSGDDSNAIKLEIMQEQTRLNIELLKSQPTDEASFDFEKMLVDVENARGGNYIDPSKTSVKKWIYICKSLEEKAQQYQKQKDKDAR